LTAKIICFVNYKGGVGKTVTTVNIAAYLAFEHGARVLLVDLDPQTNATLHLMREEIYEDWRRTHGTLNDVVDAYAHRRAPPDIHEFIVNGVVRYSRDRYNEKLQGGEIEEGLPLRYEVNSELDKLDLLPSHIDLIDADTDLEDIEQRISFLAIELGKVKGEYDYILCDCPPNLYLMTINGLYAGDSYIIPLVPDYLSTLGAHELIERVERMSSVIRRKIPCKGIIFTKVRPGAWFTRTQSLRMDIIRNHPAIQRRNIFCFSEIVFEREEIRRSEEWRLPICVSEPTSAAALEYSRLTSEFIRQV
jgi:chromosome partitioning protein